MEYAVDMPDDTRPLRILGFEPFDTGSHRAVRQSISRHSKHKWTWITRPGRAWKWRMRLGAVEMFDEALENGLFDEPIDAVFVTSLMSLSDLRALMAKAEIPGVSDMPFVLYLHENQAHYPVGHVSEISVQRDVHFALTNLTSMLAADRVVFNSRWNRESFITGIEEVLSKSPDLAIRNIRQRIVASSEVIWPPVEAPPDRANERVEKHDSVRIVWPHRWEHDKGPDELLALAEQYSESFNLRWTILGEGFREVPPAMGELMRRFAGRIDHCGHIDDADGYWSQLARCDWVLSTAKHEFFGIAVVEALLVGCLPWLPDRLSYQELLPDVAKGLSPMNPPDDPEAVHRAIRSHLEPALAVNALQRLDRALQQAVATHRSRR